MNNNKLIITVLTTFYLFCSVNAIIAGDEPEIKWGEIPIEDLEMKSFDADTNASVVILFDYGNAYFDDYLYIKYERHRRIKILDKSGYDWATRKIIYNHNFPSSTVSEIKGNTTYLDDHGEIVKVELKSDDIFTERLNDNQSMKSFTMPALKPGCVIEYHYVITSEFIHNFPKEWYFQYNEPVRWSVFETEVPNTYQFAVYKQELESLHIDELEQYNRRYKSILSDNISILLSGQKKRFVMRDVPAMREEPYAKSLDDYRAKIIYQLASYNEPFTVNKVQILQTWETLGKELMKDNDFGKRMKCPKIIKEQVEELTGSINDPHLKLLSIYNFVKSSIVWNGRYSIFASKLGDIFEKKTGDSGDINLLLAAMLKQAGIEVYPVIISTRDHGTIFTEYPLITQFNCVIVYANTGENEYVLDATDRWRPYYLLPLETLNNMGLIIFDKSVGWVDIYPTGKSMSIKVASILLLPDGSIDGIMRVTYEDYAGLNERKKIENQKQDDYIKSILHTDKTGIQGNSVKITNKDDIEKPVIIDAKIASSTYSQSFDEFIYANPIIMDQLEDNPFKLEKRDYPVDYPCLFAEYYKVHITIPKGYTLKEYPQSVTITIPEDFAGYKRTTDLKGDLLEYSTRFYINKVTFQPNEYNELRELYDKVISLESEQLVLQKNN